MDDDDAFLAALGGRPATDGKAPAPHAGAAALRAALQARREVLLEAAQARADAPPSTAETSARLESALAELRRHGLFARQESPAKAPAPSFGGLWQRMRHALGLDCAWRPSLALAGGLALVVAVAVQLVPLTHDDGDALRGAAAPVITAPDPAARARQLADALRGLGAEVALAPINPTEWNLSVDVPAGADRAAVVAALAAAGAKVPDHGSYKIVVRSAAR